MHSILEGALDAVMSMSHEGVIVWWNRSAEEMFGWSRGEVLGRPLEEMIIPERFREQHRRGLRTFIDTGDGAFIGRRAEWIALRRDGTEFPVEARITAEAHDDGLTFTAFVSDITDRRRAEDALRVESLGRVSASVAHEFNNLLMGLQPFAELLRRRAELDATLETPVRHILNVVRRGQRLTNEILRFTNSPEPRRERFDLAALIRELADESCGILVERRLQIETGDALCVRADADQLSQVVLNLVTNARDATRRGGVVTLGAARADDVPFLCDALPSPERFAAFFVRDDGCGIPAEARERLFEPFFTSRKPGGTGLGLAIAYRIVTEHGGHLVIDSAPGAGSTFYVALPAG